MDFGQALKVLKSGGSVKLSKWVMGEGRLIIFENFNDCDGFHPEILQSGIMRIPEDVSVNLDDLSKSERRRYCHHITIDDVLAEDWEIVE